MIKFTCVGLFSEIIEAYKSYSIISRAVKNSMAEINFINIRSYSQDRHKNTDDYPYGGGAGMVLTPQPVVDAVNSAKDGRDIISPLSVKHSIMRLQKLILITKN